MEWLVPVLFVLASLAQWWMQRNRQGQEEASSEKPPTPGRPAAPRREPPAQEEFGDLGDLLEALGRRRHESPPSPVEEIEPPVLPAPPAQPAPPLRREPPPVLRPEPVIVLEPPKPAPTPMVVFPEPKPSPLAEPLAVVEEPSPPRVTFRPFPAAKKADTVSTHRWAEKLRSPESVRDAIVLSEILAPPVSLR